MIRSWIKRSIVAGAGAMCRRGRITRPTVLMFHGFTEADSGPFTSTTSKHLRIGDFERLLDHLSRHYTVVSLSNLLNPQTRYQKPPVALTFDDGFASNYRLAFPLLQAYQMPATIFITTSFVDASQFVWTDRIEYALRNAVGSEPRIAGGAKTDRANDAEIAAKKTALKRLPIAKILDAVTALEQVSGVALSAGCAPEYEPLTWGHCREMQESGLIEFGNHTHNHPILARCTPAVIEEELRQADTIIRRELGTISPIVCWPNGKPDDWNASCVATSQSLGYGGAATADVGLWRIDGDPWRIPRIGVYNGLTPTQLEWILIRTK